MLNKMTMGCTHGVPISAACGACNAVPSIEQVLIERGERYGSLKGHARIAQSIKRAMVHSPNWIALSDDKKEALEMIAHKIGRILNGDPEYHDSWVDIIGYTKLIADDLDAAA